MRFFKKINSIFLILIVLVVSIATSSWGTTYYVSKTGDDSNSGTGEWANAWATINAVNYGVSGGEFAPVYTRANSNPYPAQRTIPQFMPVLPIPRE